MSEQRRGSTTDEPHAPDAFPADAGSATGAWGIRVHRPHTLRLVPQAAPSRGRSRSDSLGVSRATAPACESPTTDTGQAHHTANTKSQTRGEWEGRTGTPERSLAVLIANRRRVLLVRMTPPPRRAQSSEASGRAACHARDRSAGSGRTQPRHLSRQLAQPVAVAPVARTPPRALACEPESKRPAAWEGRARRWRNYDDWAWQRRESATGVGRTSKGGAMCDCTLDRCIGKRAPQ